MQHTDYPWDGAVRIEVAPGEAMDFGLALRIPGWARNRPVPSDLYRFTDQDDEPVTLVINGESVGLPASGGTSAGPPAGASGATISVDGGLVVIERRWQPGDVVELVLPMPVRTIAAHAQVEDNLGKVALQRGPLVYAAEAIDNDGSVLQSVPSRSRSSRPSRSPGWCLFSPRASTGGFARTEWHRR